jgi:predicted phage terminase large subunit-like protein
MKLTKKQNEILAEIRGKTRVLLYGGSRSGKTFLIVFLIVARAIKVKSRHAILRKHFAHVKQAIVFDTFDKVMKIAFKGVEYNLDKTHWFAEFGNGSQIWFGGLDDKERTEKILGNEYSTMYFNECSQITDYGTITTGLTRLAENTALPRIAFFDENPPSKRHWSYVLFIDNKIPGSGEKLGKPELYYQTRVNPIHNTDNLPEEYIEETLKTLPRKQRQRFLDGLFQDDTEGALWSADLIKYEEPPELTRIVVAIDPAVTSDPESDETGIVVVGEAKDGTLFVLGDYSGNYTPRQMASVAIHAYNTHQADRVIGEVNNGGEFIEAVLRNELLHVPYTAVRASRGKVTRAEPIVALYEQRRVFHADEFKELEDQMLTWSAKTGEKSPDRVDALVWGMTYLTEKIEQEFLVV